MAPPVRRGAEERWTDRLVDEDLAFVKRLVMTSGSLKDLASAYGISYPTVRLRLDRLIGKIRVHPQNPDIAYVAVGASVIAVWSITFSSSIMTSR